MPVITLWVEYDETKGENWPVSVIETYNQAASNDYRENKIGKFRTVNDAQSFMLGMQLVYSDIKVEKQIKYKGKVYK